MSNLFSLETFKTFSIQHIIILLIFTVIILGIGFLANRFKDNHTSIALITKILILITVLQEICDYLNRYINGTVSLNVDLPFHICSYVLFISIVVLYNKNKYLFNFCYFNAFSTALIANITPGLDGVVGDFGVFFFFLHHFLIIINVVWMIYAFDMIPDFKGLIVTVVLLNIIAVPIALVNSLIYKLGFGYANYMYLREAPPVDNFLLIGEGGRYILSMEIIAILIFMILLLPFQISRHLKSKSDSV